MCERISVKDIVAINQQFDKGSIINRGSLAFALDQANQSKSWLRACAFLVRAVLIDHVFEEGNKRTAAHIAAGYFAQHEASYSPEQLTRAITKILLKNITNLNTIERTLKDALV